MPQIGETKVKGNRTNHRLVYARDEDLKDLKERFFHFYDNDFIELKDDVIKTRTDVSWLKKLMVGILLAIMAGAIAIILTG